METNVKNQTESAQASSSGSETDAWVRTLAENARHACADLRKSATDAKNVALRAGAKALRAATTELIEVNAKDVAFAKERGRNAAFIDRLVLTEARVESMATALEQIAELPDPVGRDLGVYERPNGLRIERVAVPIGVIGMIYESRPNVGADASALCLKSGNAVLLRGGSESLHSTRVIVRCIREGLEVAHLPMDSVQLLDTKDRGAVRALLRCTEFVDLVIPRGGKSLVSLVRDEARVPTLLHLEGNCHTYVHGEADLAKAVAVTRNAKMRRTGICGATESLVIDRSIAATFLPAILDALGECEVRGEAEAQAIDARVQPVSAEDWDTEYLDAIVSVKLVGGPSEGIAFVAKHSSAHTDAILTENQEVAARFLEEIDSAVVMHNASTQFSDGGEFGFGAEIGIATGKMHARGPVGLEQLTTFKYRVLGNGQVRP